MNILLINVMETVLAGGINKTVREISKSLSRKGNNVIILQPNYYKFKSEEIYDGYRIIRLNSLFGPKFYGFCPELLFKINEIIKTYNIELIHIHGYNSLFSLEAIFIIKVLLKYDTPLVLSPHGMLSHNTFLGKYAWNIYNFFGRILLKNVDKIVNASNYEDIIVKQYLSCSIDKCVVIPHGVNVIERGPKASNKCISLIYGGYLIKLKGVEFILMAVHEIVSNYDKNVHLTIVGEGDFKPELVELADKLSIQSAIEWLPFLDEERFYQKVKESDISLLLSESENFGIVVAESLALGTQCIITNTTALVEFTEEPGCFGVDYPPDPKKVAQLIMEIKNGNMCNKHRIKSKICTWDKIIERYEMLYLDLI